MDLEKTHNRLAHRLLPREKCEGISELDDRDASRYDQIDRLLTWFAELRAKRAEKIRGTPAPEGQTSG